MIWADRWAIGVFVLGTLFWLLFGGNGPSPFYAYPVMGLVIAVPAWIIFRTLDFMSGARTKRHEKTKP